MCTCLQSTERHLYKYSTVSRRYTGAGVAQSVQGLGYRLDERASIPRRRNDGIFSVYHFVQTGSGAHPASYPVNTRDSYPRGKVARA